MSRKMPNRALRHEEKPGREGHNLRASAPTKHVREVRKVSPAALKVLRSYEFPGNARELANVIERAVIVARGAQIEPNDFPASVSDAVLARRDREAPLTLAQLEASYIAKMLKTTKGNKTECARLLGISRKNLYEKIARYGLGETGGHH